MIEYQRATVGAGNAAGSVFHRTGESPFAEAEEVGIEKGSRDHRRIHFDQVFGPSRAAEMKGPRQAAAAGARLAE